jgi:hypothetical protein
MWVIVKMMKNLNGVMIPVILLNGQSEIWEFETEDEAIEMKNIFSKNSDSGYVYEVKKV